MRNRRNKIVFPVSTTHFILSQKILLKIYNTADFSREKKAGTTFRPKLSY